MVSAVMRFFADLLRSKPSETSTRQAAAHPIDLRTFAPGHPVRNVEEDEIVWTDTPRYPAYDHGFPAASPDKLLDQHAKLMSRLRLAATYDGEWSKSAVTRVVRNYAAYVNCLPATYQENHYGAGGLLKLGLDVGFYSLQAANGVIFSNESADRRTVAEPRWKLAAFIAGLTFELNRVISHILVTNKSGGQWHPFVETLSDWLAKTDSERFWVVWLKPSDAANQKALVSFILPKIIPLDVIDYLAEDRRVLMLMNAAITGGMKMGDDNPILLLVGKVRYKVIEADLSRNANLLARPQIGSHLEPHIVDAMRSLFSTGAWEPNVKNGRLWVTGEGVFLVWRTAAADIMGRLRLNNTPGMPQDIETIYDIMASAKILSHAPDSGRFWRIRLKDAKTLVDAIRLATPAMFFGDLKKHIDAADFQLLDPTAEAKQTTAPSSKPAAKPQDGKRSPAKKPAPNQNAELPLDRNTMPSEGVAGEAAPGSQVTEPARQESRTLARLQPAVATVLKSVRERIKSGEVVPRQIDDKAIGLPWVLFDESTTKVPRLAVLTALSKEKVLYTPPGQAKKIIVITDESGESKEYLGIFRVYARDIFGIE